MPRELVALAQRTSALRDYEERPLQPDEIRVRTEYGAPKHGTELHGFAATVRMRILTGTPRSGCLCPARVRATRSLARSVIWRSAG